MPRLPSPVLRQVVIAAGCLTLVVSAIALPARHVLLPPWPDQVNELLMESGPGQVERRFVEADIAADAAPSELARSRPVSLWRIERSTGPVDHVWLAGVRGADGTLLPGLPTWLETVRIDGPLPEPVRLVVVDADQNTRDVDGGEITRMYRPNGLSEGQRVDLWADRLSERWQWPFSATTDARMTPPVRWSEPPRQP